MNQQQGMNPGISDSAEREQSAGSWKKCLMKIGAVILIVFFCLMIALGVLAKTLISKDRLVQEIEKSINSEVMIGSMEISVFRIPANITLKEVVLAAKEEQSTAKPPVKIGEVSLSLGLWELLQKKINVTNITIREAEITNIYHEDGTTSLRKIFQSPDEKKRRQRTGDVVEQGGFNAHDHEKIVHTLGGLFIENARFEIILEGMELRLLCSDMDVELSSIKVDPRQLATVNDARLKIRGRVRIDSSEGRRYGDLYVSGESGARIFNPNTGDVEPEVSGELSLKDESWLSAEMPFITRSWNHLSILEKVGIKVGKLPEKATFGRSKSVAVHYHLGKISVEKPLSIWLGDWEIAVLDGGWLDTMSDQHHVRGELLASQKASVILRSLTSGLVNMLPEELQQMVASDLKKELFRDDRLLVKIKSSGDFSDPRIRPDGKIVDVSQAAKDAAKQLMKQKAGSVLEGLLK